MKVSRRDFAKIIGAATLGAATIPALGAKGTENEEAVVTQQNSARNFPKDFYKEVIKSNAVA